MKQVKTGITLVEILIALVILAVIAIMTVPKILKVASGSQDAEHNRKALEAASIIQAAYAQYRLNHNPTGTTDWTDIMAYADYVKITTTLRIDYHYTNGGWNCYPAPRKCWVLKNGGVLGGWNDSFGNTSSTNATWLLFDPDGVETDGTTNGPGKSTQFWLYYDGHLRHVGNMDDDTYWGGGGPQDAQPTKVPPWFSWD